MSSGTQNVSNSKYTGLQNKSWREFRELEKESKREKESRNKSSLRFTASGSNVSNSNEQRTQVPIKREHTSIEMSGSSSKETWWQTQSSLCRVPDGVSYELDKHRTNRIKALGNSIVPLIARELGLAIMKAEQDG